jgi:hypothetical protein
LAFISRSFAGFFFRMLTPDFHNLSFEFVVTAFSFVSLPGRLL